MVKRIPSGVVICIIDGVEFFSNSIHLPLMNVIMRFLNDLMGIVAGSRSNLVFKMLGASLAPQWLTRLALYLTLGNIPRKRQEAQVMKHFFHFCMLSSISDCIGGTGFHGLFSLGNIIELSLFFSF